MQVQGGAGGIYNLNCNFFPQTSLYAGAGFTIPKSHPSMRLHCKNPGPCSDYQNIPLEHRDWKVPRNCQWDNRCFFFNTNSHFVFEEEDKPKGRNSLAVAPQSSQFSSTQLKYSRRFGGKVQTFHGKLYGLIMFVNRAIKLSDQINEDLK